MVLLSGCQVVPDQVEVDAVIGLDDECLTAFPSCSAGFDKYECVDPDGDPRPECQVACAAARSMTCDEDGVHCWNRLAGDDVEVLTLCVKSE